MMYLFFKINSMAKKFLTCYCLSFCFVAFGGEVDASNTGVKNEYGLEDFKNAKVLSLYRGVFRNYFSLDWVKNPRLGTVYLERDIPNIGAVKIYEICKPHNCSGERLIFILDEKQSRAWGKVYILSDVLGQSAPVSIEKFINRFEGGLK